MQTVIEMSEETFKALEEISVIKGASTAKVGGWAVEEYLQERTPAKIKADGAALDAAFGIWKHRGEDALDFQKRIRGE